MREFSVEVCTGETFKLRYPDKVVDYIASRQEQREFVKAKKPGDAIPKDIPEHFAMRAKVTVDELCPLLEKFDFTPVNSMMDIGCGFGATTTLLAKVLNAKQIHMIEGRGTILKVTGYNQQVDAWNDVMMAETMVRANVRKDRQLFPWYFDELPEKLNMHKDGLDLITSFRSWGHHYPVKTYLDHAKRWLKPGGALCLDVRISNVPHEDGLGMILQAGFEQLAWVSEHSASAKSKRLLFRAPS